MLETFPFEDYFVLAMTVEKNGERDKVAMIRQILTVCVCVCERERCGD